MSNYTKKLEKSKKTRIEIFDYAEKVAEKIGFSVGEDLFVFIKKKFPNSKIKTFPDDDKVDYIAGRIEVDKKDTFTIYLSNLTGYFRDRFTIAHELGHYYLHSNEGKKTISSDRDSSASVTEAQANCFAAAFLMPSKKFLEADKQCKQDNDRMAGIFQVSRMAINIRRKSLNK